MILVTFATLRHFQTDLGVIIYIYKLYLIRTNRNDRVDQTSFSVSVSFIFIYLNKSRIIHKSGIENIIKKTQKNIMERFYIL